ncbi:MAG: M48 family metallopeptidase [Candidatus Omnitrophica bacterium]|nr:M48 family metallopeptidase [Candidatus Omnitrophota bacterium]
MNKAHYFFTVLISVGVLLAGCATFVNPLTGRQESVLLGTPYEVALGRQMQAEIARTYPPDPSPETQARAQRILQQLAPHADRQDISYECTVVKNNTVNAFVVPGGFIYVHSALLEQANDDELCAVIAHEIGHVVARHGIKKLQANLGFSLLMNIVLGAESAEKTRQILGVCFSLVSLGYSRQDEFAADELAIKYTRAAGYNPEGLASFFEKLRLKYGDVSSFEAWASDHPPLKQRIERIRQLSARG